MKQNLINNEDNSPKSGKLSIALYPNALRKSNGKEIGYYARVVNRRRLGMDDIFNDLLSEDGSIDTVQMKKLWNRAVNAIAMRISTGISVDFGLGVLSPSVTGSFASEQSEFNRNRNSITVKYRPSPDIKKTMDSLEPVITRGNTCRPEVTRIFDHGSGWDSVKLKEDQSLESGSLSMGNLLIIEGKNLRIDGSSAEVGLYFDNIAEPDKSIRLEAVSLCRNNPGVLECIIPRELDQDAEYRIRLVTQFMPGSRLRESPQSYSFPTVFRAV